MLKQKLGRVYTTTDVVCFHPPSASSAAGFGLAQASVRALGRNERETRFNFDMRNFTLYWFLINK